MRILHIVGSLNRGGAETWLVQVLRNIDRKNYEFDFLVHGNGPYDYQAEVESLGSRVIPCLSPHNPFAYSRNFMRVLRDFGPYDCVHGHVHYFSGLPLLLAARAGIPIRVIQSHLDTAPCDRESGTLRKAYIWTMKRMIWSAATRGIAVSELAADSLFPRGWKGRDQWTTISLGIDLEPYRRNVDPLEVRRELGIPKDAFVVGHAGRFVDQKNHSFLIEIAADCVRACPRAFFLLLGEGPMREEMERKASALGLGPKILFAGVRPDVGRVMKGAMDAFLFPSRYEGLGLVVLEAQAAGLPCLVSDMVPEEADVGIGLVSRASLNQSAADWATQLLHLRSLKRESGVNPPQLDKFTSVQHSGEQLLDLYRACMG